MIISLSILNINKNDRKNQIDNFQFDSNNWIHFDIMDGQFVNNITFKYEVVKEVNDYSSLFKDVHLMTYNPIEYLKEYQEAGANQITFHYESVENIEATIEEIKKYNMKVGISIKPNTNVRVLKKYLSMIDLVLVMSVEPGKGGQTFMNDCLKKIKWLNKEKRKYHYLISVDGGINKETSKLVKKAGADVIVVGSYLTKETIEKDKVLELMVG